MKPYLEKKDERLVISESNAEPFPEHLHTQAEMLYVFSGTAVMTVGGETVRLEAGDLCVCFPGVVHGYGQPSSAQTLMLIFSPEIVSDFSSALAHSCPEQPVLRRPALPADVALCMQQLREECAQGGDARVLRGYLQVVLARTAPLMKLKSRGPEISDVAYRAIKYLSEHFTEPVTLETASQALGVSKSHLSHTFSQRMGTNFRAYVNALRLDLACEMLKETDESITRIAYECGFESQRTFNRVFAEQHGAAPSDYRRRFRPGR